MGSVSGRRTCRRAEPLSWSSTSPQVRAAASERRSSPSRSTESRATSTLARQEARSADSRRLPSPRERLPFAVAPGDALLHPPDPLVLGPLLQETGLIHHQHRVLPAQVPHNSDRSLLLDGDKDG